MGVGRRGKPLFTLTHTFQILTFLEFPSPITGISHFGGHRIGLAGAARIAAVSHATCEPFLPLPLQISQLTCDLQLLLTLALPKLAI